MPRKSNISLSNRALFSPSRKNTLQQHEESQNSNVVKRDLSKQETDNSSLPNLLELRSGWLSRILRYPRVRVHSHTFEAGEPPNKSNITSVTPPLQNFATQSKDVALARRAQQLLKAKVLSTQPKSNQHNLSGLRRVFSRCSAGRSLVACNPRSSTPFGTNFRVAKNSRPSASAPRSSRFAPEGVEEHFGSPTANPMCSQRPSASAPRSACFAPEGVEHLWGGSRRGPAARDISVQWLERLGFTFSPFAFIFGTTFLFAALASTLQKQDGKLWLQTLAHTKLPGLTESKVSQMSSWVFLESVLSQYINRDNSLLVSTRPLWGQPERSSGNSLWQEAPDSAKLREGVPPTATFVRPKPAIGAVELGTALEIQLSPIWSQHIKKDFLGVFPLRQTNGTGGRFDKGSAPLGFARSPERSLNKSKIGRLGCLVNQTRGFVNPAQSVYVPGDPLRGANLSAYAPRSALAGGKAAVAGTYTDQSSVRAPELKKTLIWPWYQIMAYHPPNRLILPTWDGNTITEAKVSRSDNTWATRALARCAQLEFAMQPKIGSGRCSASLSKTAPAAGFARPTDYSNEVRCEHGLIRNQPAKTNLRFVDGAVEYAPKKVTQVDSATRNLINFNPASLDCEAAEPASGRPVGKGSYKDQKTLLRKAKSRPPERIAGPVKQSDSNSSRTLRKILCGLDCGAAKLSLSESQKGPKVGVVSRAELGWPEGPQNNFDTSVERLRLEDDSIPSKKASIYSKNKVHQDTLSARVLNVVKKSFYEYGLSIPGSAERPILVPSGRAEPAAGAVLFSKLSTALLRKVLDPKKT